MTYKYRPTYNRETQAYAYLDFDFEFRMHTPAQNAHKFLCKLIEEHVWRASLCLLRGKTKGGW